MIKFRSLRAFYILSLICHLTSKDIKGSKKIFFFFSVILKHPALPPCAVGGCSTNPLYYYYSLTWCVHRQVVHPIKTWPSSFKSKLNLLLLFFVCLFVCLFLALGLCLHVFGVLCWGHCLQFAWLLKSLHDLGCLCVLCMNFIS